MAFPKVLIVIPLENFKLRLHLDNNEVRIFDTKPYLEKGIFQELKNSHYFQQVRTFFGGVQWPNDQDFSPATLYLESIPLDSEEKSSLTDEKQPQNLRYHLDPFDRDSSGRVSDRKPIR